MKNGLDALVCECREQGERRGAFAAARALLSEAAPLSPRFPRHFNPCILPLGSSACFHIPSKTRGFAEILISAGF